MTGHVKCRLCGLKGGPHNLTADGRCAMFTTESGSANMVDCKDRQIRRLKKQIRELKRAAAEEWRNP